MAAVSGGKHLWGGGVRQVTKSNFAEALRQIKGHIRDADFVAVSSQKTGDFANSAPDRHPWRRLLPIDTPETAYLKAKLAAETFEVLHFAVCPFRLDGSKVLAFPYNFHLFPRDELNLGMPSYSFSCQTSFLTSMAREGFDFNVCIYDGISYLSRVQESKAKERNPIPRMLSMTSPNPSVADSVFMGRIKSRVEHWRNACKDPGKTTDGPLVKSLRKLILGGEVYGSRPCMSIDVCSDRQVQLVLETVSQICDDLVPLVVPDKGGEPKAVRVVLTSSEEDKDLLMSEVQILEEEQNLKIRGFREVIDLISNSHKPIIAYNCLHGDSVTYPVFLNFNYYFFGLLIDILIHLVVSDFTFIHSKFLGPLPPSLTEFMCSLRLVFSNVIDISHLLKEVGPLRKAKNLPAALNYLNRQFFVPIDMEIPQQAAEGSNDKYHGHKVLRITQLFGKLSNLLKIVPGCQTSLEQQTTAIEDYANTFYPCCNTLQEPGDEDVGFWKGNVRRTSTDNLVFLWGFNSGISATELKRRLHGGHTVFTEDFELQLVDETCAVVVFWSPTSVVTLLNDMGVDKIGSCAPTEMISEGLKAAGYEAYRKVCRMGLWEADLTDSLERALSEHAHDLSTDSRKDDSEVYWCSDSMIDLNDL